MKDLVDLFYRDMEQMSKKAAMNLAPEVAEKLLTPSSENRPPKPEMVEMFSRDFRVLKLACLLASYEMDEPHVSLPDLPTTEEAQHYPEIKPEQFLGWLKEEHAGDCVKMPAPCIRCFAEMIAHKAKWLDGKL